MAIVTGPNGQPYVVPDEVAADYSDEPAAEKKPPKRARKPKDD